jgi:hypothetical protein
VGTFPKSNIKIPHCGNSSKIKHKNTTLCFYIWFWNCSHSVVFLYLILELFPQCGIFIFDFGTVPTVWYFYIWFWICSHSVVFLYLILELLPQCGIFILDFGTVPTVWYFYIWFWNCSHSVVFLCLILELFPQCGVFIFDFNSSKIKYKNTTLWEQFQNQI